MFCGVDTVCAIFAYYVLTRPMRHSGKACQIGTKRLAGPWKRRQGESSRNRGTATPCGSSIRAHTSPVGCRLLAPEMSAAAHVRYVGSCTKGHRIRNNSRLDLIIRVVITRLERPLRRLEPTRLRLCYILALSLVALQSSFPCCYCFPVVHYSRVLVQRFALCDFNCSLKHDS